METKIANSRDTNGTAEYREAVKKLIDTEVGNIIDEEIRKAARELIEEQRKAIRDAVEQHKLVIRQVVEEEKRAIWARVEELRKSIVRLGMG
jgi:polyhydroxyalkanoate synthesis regulator phasin